MAIFLTKRFVNFNKRILYIVSAAFTFIVENLFLSANQDRLKVKPALAVEILHGAQTSFAA